MAPDTAPELFPRPQRLEVLGDGARLDAPVRVTETDRLPPEGYELEITPAAVWLRHRDESGRRYGLASLGQIREQAAERLPGLRIGDWPDFPVRAYMLDISRDRVPTRATLERLVGLLALARVNQLQLYIEHTFAYREHEVVWRHASPLTAEDVRWLDEQCRGAGIELVANQNCFGHMGRWLQHEAYRQRAEAPDGFELLPGVQHPPSVLAPTPDNAAFAHDLFDELLPNFSSRRVNVGFDEPFELGRGASRAEVERRGRVAVYVEHLQRIADPLLAQGYEVLFCDDVVRHEPQLAAELPDEMVTLAWTYDAPPASGERLAPPAEISKWMERAGIGADDHIGFAARVAPLVEVGRPFWVMPGTSSWNSLVGRVDNARANLTDAAEVGREQGACGYVISDWGDNGHLQPPSVSFGPLLFGGAVSWALAANRDLDLAAALDRYAFRDASCALGGALDELGRVWRGTGQRAFNASPLQVALAPHQLHFVVGKPDPGKVCAVVDRIDAALTAIDASEPACVDGELVRDELRTAARLARHGALRMLGVAERTDLEVAIAEQERCWLARSRPGGLVDSLAHLHRSLADYPYDDKPG